MDDVVRQAMIKWPNVPDCRGWLGLSARGEWFLRDPVAQAAGAFGSGHVGARGDRIRHKALIGFIGRNYACDEGGQWFFQNGPQRVYVELERTPWVMRLWPDGTVRTHTGLKVQPLRCLIDERGMAYLEVSQGLGLVHSQDMDALATCLESGAWRWEEALGDQLPRRFGYVPSPLAREAGRTP